MSIDANHGTDIHDNQKSEKQVESIVIDLEEYAKAGKKPPQAEQYRIRIDKEQYVVDMPALTGRQLLELAGKTPPENYMIHQKLKGGETKKIELEVEADFTEPGVERFMTIPLDQTEG